MPFDFFPKKLLKPLFSPALDLLEVVLALCMLPDECEVAEDVRFATSCSFATLAFLAPTVSACSGGTSKVGNMSTCQSGPIYQFSRRGTFNANIFTDGDSN